MTVYLSSMHISSQLVPHVDFSILVVIQLFRSASSCLTERIVLLILQQSKGLVPCELACNHGKSPQSVCKAKAFLVLSSLKTYMMTFLVCFGALASSGAFQACFQG